MCPMNNYHRDSRPDFATPATPASAGGVTVLQERFIRSLLVERQMTDEARKVSFEQLEAGKVDKARASRWIERLLTLPKAAPVRRSDRDPVMTPGEFDMIPSGRYALEVAGDALNPIHFFKVKHGGASKNGGRDWTGFVFVDRIVGEDRIKVQGRERFRVLNEIKVDPFAAGQLYGFEEGRCCICGKNLTRELSRELGIGPVCGGRLHEDFGVLAKKARRHLEAYGIDPDANVENPLDALVEPDGPGDAALWGV